MKIFTKDNTCWDTKVNFVDENNVFLGYDLSQSCCEKAGWFISDSRNLPKTWSDVERIFLIEENTEQDLSDFVFDTTVFEQHNPKECCDFSMIVLRIVNSDASQEKFIHIYNCHNRYYAHGFEMKKDDKIIQEGQI